jgi:hypothetical protein
LEIPAPANAAAGILFPKQVYHNRREISSGKGCILRVFAQEILQKRRFFGDLTILFAVDGGTGLCYNRKYKTKTYPAPSRCGFAKKER